MHRAVFRALRRRSCAAYLQHWNRRGALFHRTDGASSQDNAARSGRLAIGGAACMLTCVPSFLVCIDPHPPERISCVRWRPPACRHPAFQLPLHRSSTRSRQPAILATGAARGVRLACRRIADIERAVGSDRVHDHRLLARHGDTGLAAAGAFCDRLASALDLVGALGARHQPRSRLVSERRTSASPAFDMRP